jgi:acetoin utilization deacetylase AcuC-like enzyme
MRVGIVYDDIYLTHENPFGHPERGERLKSIMEALRGSDVWEQLVQVKPRKATFEELEYVHSRAHVEHMKKFTGYADPDTYVSEGSLEAALYAAGGVMEAVDRCRAGEISTSTTETAPSTSSRKTARSFTSAPTSTPTTPAPAARTRREEGPARVQPQTTP